jgi:nicotinamide-nucleotide amidase
MSLRVACLCIGDELLDGRLSDTNSQRLGALLFDLGTRLERTIVVADSLTEISDTLRELSGSFDLVVTSGGLGPTSDDLTAEGVGLANQEPVSLNREAWDHIQARFQKRGLPLPENNRRQAEVPQSSQIILNEAGVAPAFVTRVGQGEVWSLPGVPSEFDYFLHSHLRPRIEVALQNDSSIGLFQGTVRCLGMTESSLAQSLSAFEAKYPELRIQYRTHFPENHVRMVLDLDGSNESAMRSSWVGKSGAQIVTELVEEARENIGGAAYGTGDQSLPERVIQSLKDAGHSLSVAESCTGGMVGELLTEVAGASSVFRGGIIAYSNDAKTCLLDVPAERVELFGAVSEEVAEAMAAGAAQRLTSTWSVSITGIAGPGGGTEDKPVGTVCFGLSGPRGTSSKRRFLVFPDRDRIRKLSAAIALRWVLTELKRYPDSDK